MYVVHHGRLIAGLARARIHTAVQGRPRRRTRPGTRHRLLSNAAHEPSPPSDCTTRSEPWLVATRAHMRRRCKLPKARRSAAMVWWWTARPSTRHVRVRYRMLASAGSSSTSTGRRLCTYEYTSRVCIRGPTYAYLYEYEHARVRALHHSLQVRVDPRRLPAPRFFF